MKLTHANAYITEVSCIEFNHTYQRNRNM